MDTTLVLITVATLVISLISLIGGLLLLANRSFTQKLPIYLVGFAAGVMLATSFFDLLPEAFRQTTNGNIFSLTLLGIITFFFMERFVLWFHHHDDTHNAKPTTVLIILGDGLHNIFDGVAIAASFMTSPAIGLATTLAIAAHEIPQEIADFAILLHGGMKAGKALLFNFLSALTAFVGAFLGYFFLQTISGLTPLFLAFSAGMFIYISCSDLIPDMHQDFKKQKAWCQTLPFILGIILMWVIIHLVEA